MNKIVFPALLVATIMVAGAFAFMPVEQASTVHLSGTTVAGSLSGALTGAIVTHTGNNVAVPITAPIVELTSAGTEAWTLVDGANGQILYLVMVAQSTGAGTLTPTTLAVGSTIVFDAVGDAVTLVFNSTSGWIIVSSVGI